MAGVTEKRPRAEMAVVARLVLGLVLLAAVVAFALDNRDDVRVGWVFGDVEASLAVVLLMTAVAGACIGWLVLHLPRRDRDT